MTKCWFAFTKVRSSPHEWFKQERVFMDWHCPIRGELRASDDTCFAQDTPNWSVHILIYSHIIYHSYSMKFYDLQFNVLMLIDNHIYIHLLYIYIQLIYPNNIKHDFKANKKTQSSQVVLWWNFLRQETLDLKSRHPSGLRAARLKTKKQQEFGWVFWWVFECWLVFLIWRYLLLK